VVGRDCYKGVTEVFRYAFLQFPADGKQCTPAAGAHKNMKYEERGILSWII
jgi:hypothetical protein